MKAILMSDRPKWCALMMNGDKTVEVRKGIALYKAINKLIEQYGYADIYVYCTKGKPYLYKMPNGKREWFLDNGLWRGDDYEDRFLSGKVVFKFRCYDVEEIYYGGRYNQFDPYTACYYTNKLIPIYLKHRTCLEYDELGKYLNGYERLKGKRGIVGTAIHISYLEIFDKPKELSEFKSYKKNIVNTKINGMVFETELDNSLIKAPQSWCYVEVE